MTCSGLHNLAPGRQVLSSALARCQNLADLYISSYTPTLTALIRARRPGPSGSATEEKHLVAIGERGLLSVGTELANIGQRVDGLATFTRTEGLESCISRVAEELSKN